MIAGTTPSPAAFGARVRACKRPAPDPTTDPVRPGPLVGPWCSTRFLDLVEHLLGFFARLLNRHLRDLSNGRANHGSRPARSDPALNDVRRVAGGHPDRKPGGAVRTGDQVRLAFWVGRPLLGWQSFHRQNADVAMSRDGRGDVQFHRVLCPEVITVLGCIHGFEPLSVFYDVRIRPTYILLAAVVEKRPAPRLNRSPERLTQHGFERFDRNGKPAR